MRVAEAILPISSLSFSFCEEPLNFILAHDYFRIKTPLLLGGITQGASKK